MPDGGRGQRRIPRTIPRGATEQEFVDPRAPRGTNPRFDYTVDGRVVACVYYHPSGAVEWEQHFDDQARIHGVERREYPDGRLSFRAAYVHGEQHGLQQQWDPDGALLCTTRFVRGTGVDLWFHDDFHGGWELAEEREYVAGMRHGVERWWRGGHVHEEIMLYEDQKHGIERRWNQHGRLCRGYPRYFVRDEQVTRPQYERARLGEPTLPAFRDDDNVPVRGLPVVRARRGKARWSRA